MKRYSLGEQLRAARIKKELSLYDVEKVSGVEAQYLLAMEMDQLKALPKDIQQEALEKYATSVDLDGKHLYEEQKKNERKVKEEKKQVVAAMAAMDTKYQKAVDTERLLKGRGFEETLVTFGANGNINVDVSTKGKELTRKDVANIKSVVMMQTGTTEDKIVIHPMN